MIQNLFRRISNWIANIHFDRRMFAPFEWMLALRYLRARRQEGFISVIAGFSLAGIALGVATLIIVMAVMNGFRGELMGRILALNGHLMVQGAGNALANFDDIAKKMRALPGVIRATPIVEGQAFATAGNAGYGVLIRGIQATDLTGFREVSRSLSPGAMQRFQGGAQVIVGQRLADRMGLLPGMTITLLTARGNVTPFGVTPRAKTYTIAGTFSVGMAEYDSTFVFMPLREAQAYFNQQGQATAVEIMLSDPENAGDMREKIAGVLSAPARIIDWREANATFFNVLKIERNVMFLILSLIILVAALNIVSGMIMLVKDKGRDIAILRTMGASKGAIMRVFLISGSSIGIIGTLIGVVLGVVFCWNIESIRQFASWVLDVKLFDPEIYQLTRMPATMESGEIVAVVIMALSLSVLATIYPAWRAARLDPVEALRYE
jgi:lipoprotein-releasing system permease protein